MRLWVLLSVTAIAFSVASSVVFASDELTLHFIPSPEGINWSRPKTLADTTLLNQVAKVNGGGRAAIGHVYVEMKCGENHFFTGATDIGYNQELKALFIDGYGLGVILKNYHGILNDSDKAEKDLAAMHVTGRSNFLRFLISAPTCARLLGYLEEYKLRGYDKIYGGLNARPRRGEGAGCSAFGASFLGLAGVLSPELEESFTRTLILPRRLVGGELTRTRVSFFKILLDEEAEWDKDLSQGGFLVHFYDPERMFDWVVHAAESMQTGSDRRFPWPGWVSFLGQSKGVTFDATQVLTPTDPIFSVPAPF